MSSWQQAFGHGSRVFGLAFHPHSPNVIASASEDETVRVWGRDASGGDWQQASCCRGHTSEVLRVAWSPDGRLLASGSADHTVRFWSVSTKPTQQSYAGSQVAVLSGHPEEVYGLHFIPDTPLGSSSSSSSQTQQQQVQHAADQLAGSILGSPAAAAASVTAGSSSNSSGSTCSARLLLTASGESLYLWDLEGGQLLQQSAPLPVLQTSPAFAAAVAGSNAQQQQQQQQQQNARQAGTSQRSTPTTKNNNKSSNQPTSSSSTSSSQHGQSGFRASSSEGSDEEEQQQQGFEEPPPSYIFGVAVCPETNWAAATCSDGMLRLWDASRAALTEVAAVQVHSGQMGSSVSWLPQQPLCVASISKSGHLVLQDVRLLGRPLLQQQLEGPVFDAVWLMGANPWGINPSPGATAAAAAGVGAGPGMGPSSGAGGGAPAVAGGGAGGVECGGVQQLQLVVAGRDSKLRAYSLDAACLQRGMLGGPQVICTSPSYGGSLLGLAATADGRWVAAAGEAVEAHTLRPAQQQQQQQHAPAAAGPQAVRAPPKRRGGSSGRRAGGSTGRAAVDLMSLEVDDSVTGQALAGLGGLSNGTAVAVAAARGPGGHGIAANCAAAAAATLTRAPVFIWSS